MPSSWYKTFRGPMHPAVKWLLTVVLLLALYALFQIYPQEAAFHEAKRSGEANPQLLSSFALRYPDSYRIGEVDDLLWRATSGPQGECALYLYQQVFPYGKHAQEASRRPARQEPGCAARPASS